MGGDHDGAPANAEDFYDRLFKLAFASDLKRAVGETLSLLIQRAEAALGYVELRSLTDPAVRYSVALSSTSAEVSRDALSTAVLDHVISRGEVYGGKAMTDARFSEDASVRANQIENVMVVPIEVDVGAVYFQARRGDEFDAQIQRRIEHFAHCLQPLTVRLVGEASLETETTAYERRRVLEALTRNGWNITATADELGVKRQSMYPLLRRLGIGLR